MREDFANKVYDILVQFGAREDDRDSFVYHHCKDKYPATEWRFCGVFGFGGKYRSGNNYVTYYSEDETPERETKLNEVNELLNKMEIDFHNSI